MIAAKSWFQAHTGLECKNHGWAGRFLHCSRAKELLKRCFLGEEKGVVFFFAAVGCSGMNCSMQQVVVIVGPEVTASPEAIE
jgi:hypothetical protein